ncbi:MAG: hypothetical protein ACK4V2_01140 [Pseudomonadota bacterium]|nr:hypothetical protein [Alphaproteobacteria bacterium]
MKKYLLLAAVLVAQLFTADLPLTARFINLDDLSNESSIHLTMKNFVGADTEEKWISAKSTMERQIAQNTMRRVLFFRGEELVTSARSGRMPLGMQPYFCENVESSSEEHNALRGTIEIDELTNERLDIIRDTYASLLTEIAETPNYKGVVRSTVPQMPIMLVTDTVHAATIMFSSNYSDLNPVEIQDQIAAAIIRDRVGVSSDANITAEGYPIFLISQLACGQNVVGSRSTYVIDLPYNAGREGITPTLITLLNAPAIEGNLAERLALIRDRVDEYISKLA